mmetsp:Transcript_105401/g.293444  ORF Transcript_105401/g.293444 Transcript_105401/m.293444 type:complete len:591 (-) Transcript_105401:157-1929(-)
MAEVWCNCCGKSGHKKKECKFVDKECSICGKVGHLKAVCKQAEQAWTEEIWCKCCGKTGHEKKDCKYKDQACSICGKTGHLKAMCRQAEASWAYEVPTASADACRCCGKTGHKKKECKFVDKECSICGKIGHLKAVCKHNATAAGYEWTTGSAQVCKCCGKAGHVKKDCKFVDKECSICGKVGHLKAACRQAEAASGAKPKAKAKAKAKAKGKAKAKAAAKPVEEEEPKEERKEELINYTLDDGTGGAWELNSGVSKKLQKRKERAKEEAASAKAMGYTPGMSQQHIPGMAPMGMSQGGSKVSQALAAAEVAAILNKKGPEVEAPAPGSTSSAQVKVPEKKIGIVIGPKGAKIQMIQEKTGAKIDTTGEIFTITGPPASVAQAEQAVRELVEKGYCAMQYEDFSENFVTVHPCYFPDLIGKGGVIIREIKDKLGVEVNIPTVPPGSAPSKKFKVGLAGSATNVEKAKGVINDIATYGHAELTHPGQVHEEMEVDPWCYKYIIGKAGSELKHIQHNWKVKLSIPREHSANQKVLIVGEQDQVERAKTYVEKVLWNAENQSKGRDRVDNQGGDFWGEDDEEEDWMKAYIYKR